MTKFVLFVPLYKGKMIHRYYDNAAKAIKAFRTRVARFPRHDCCLNVEDVYGNIDHVVTYRPHIHNTATCAYVEPTYCIGTKITAILGA